MTNNEAYGIIANHIFIAMQKHGGKSVIILADNLQDAEEKAKAFFKVDSVTVFRIIKVTENGICEI